MRSTFIGQYLHTLDPKNRLFIPPRFRKELEKEDKKFFFLTLGPDGCLRMFLPSDWEKFQDRLGVMKLEDKRQQRAMIRTILANAGEAEVDDQGRILVPQHLKESAGLRKEVFVIGMGDQIELWDRQRFTAYDRKSRKTMELKSKDIEI